MSLRMLDVYVQEVRVSSLMHDLPVQTKDCPVRAWSRQSSQPGYGGSPYGSLLELAAALARLARASRSTSHPSHLVRMLVGVAIAFLIVLPIGSIDIAQLQREWGAEQRSCISSDGNGGG